MTNATPLREVRNQQRIAAMEELERNDNEIADTLVGALIGHCYVTDRVKPGKRWQYVVLNRRVGASRHLRGYELVRMARQARADGLPVIMPATPWRDETDEKEDAPA